MLLMPYPLSAAQFRVAKRRLNAEIEAEETMEAVAARRLEALVEAASSEEDAYMRRTARQALAIFTEEELLKMFRWQLAQLLGSGIKEGN